MNFSKSDQNKAPPAPPVPPATIMDQLIEMGMSTKEAEELCKWGNICKEFNHNVQEERVSTEFHLDNSCIMDVLCFGSGLISPELPQIYLEKIQDAYLKHIQDGETLHDFQIDVRIFNFLCGRQEITKFCGDTEKNLENGLKELDKSVSYCLRTGPNNKSGHYRVAYFNNGKWKVHSSLRNPSTNFDLTKNDGTFATTCEKESKQQLNILIQ